MRGGRLLFAATVALAVSAPVAFAAHNIGSALLGPAILRGGAERQVHGAPTVAGGEISTRPPPPRPAAQARAASSRVAASQVPAARGAKRPNTRASVWISSSSS